MNPSLHRQTRILLLGFGLVVVLMAFLVVLALSEIEQSRRILNDAVSEHNGCIDLSSQMYRISRERMSVLEQTVAEPDPFAQNQAFQHFRHLAGDFIKARDALFKRELSLEELKMLGELGQHISYIVPLQERVIEMSLVGRRSDAQEILIKRVVPAHGQMLAKLVDFSNYQTTEMRKAVEETRKNENHAFVMLLFGGAVTIALALLIAAVVHNRMASLTGRLARTADNLNASLRELEAQKLAIDEHAIVSITDAQGRMTYVNETFCTHSQYQRSELLGKQHHVLSSKLHPAEFFADLWQTISNKQVWHGEICNQRKDGTPYWLDTTIVPFLDESGRPYQYVAVQTDITVAKEAEAVLARGKEELEALVLERTADLQERQALLGEITSAAQDAIIMIDDTDSVTFWNKSAEEVFGYGANEVIGRKLHDLIMPARFRAEYEPSFAKFIETGQGNFVGKHREVVALHRDGSEFPLELSLSAVKIKERWTGIGLARDITERKQAEEVLKQLATTDPLTGVANRRRLDTALEMEMKRAERYHFPLSLVLFDIDHFKEFNDTYGHQAGDQVLIDLTMLVAGNIRANDLFARWGGEEFAILATNCETSVAQLFSEKLCTLIEEFKFREVGRVTCSFGLTSFRPGENAMEFMARADKALYLAKTSGRNRVESI